MKRLTLILAFWTALVGQSFGTPSNWFSVNNPQYFYSSNSGQSNWLYVEPDHYAVLYFVGGYAENAQWAYAYFSPGWQNGWVEGETFKGLYNYSTGWKNYAYTFFDGDLFNGTFNSKTDTLTATFDGWFEAYNTKTGYWYYDGDVSNATFRLNLSNGNLTLSGGAGAPAALATPEPTSLTLLGTGLLALAGKFRKMVKA